MKECTMIYREIFEKSRFSVMCEAVCSAQADGKLLYKNSAFKELCRGYVCNSVEFEKVPGKDEILNDSFKLGRIMREFDLAKIDLFGEKMIVCSDVRLHGENFPIVQNERMYIGLDAIGSPVLIPVFGGRVIKLSGSNDIVEPVSDFEIGYFCLDKIVSAAVKLLKEKVASRGYRIDTDILSPGNPVCNVNLFDFILVLELLMLIMLKSSDERSVKVSVAQREGSCSVIIDIMRENGTTKSGRISPEKLFDNEEIKKTVESIMSFCSLYMWKLVARVDSDRCALAFSLPIYNHEPSKFRNVTDNSCDRAVIQVSDLLAQTFDMFLQ